LRKATGWLRETAGTGADCWSSWAASEPLTGSAHWFNNGTSLTAGGSGIDLRYAHMSVKSASEITLAAKVGMVLAGGCRTMAINDATAIGRGASFGPAPP